MIPDGLPAGVAGLPVVLARCCRTWLVALWVPMGRCGLCHTRPLQIPTPKQESTA